MGVCLDSGERAQVWGCWSMGRISGEGVSRVEATWLVDYTKIIVTKRLQPACLSRIHSLLGE